MSGNAHARRHGHVDGCMYCRHKLAAARRLQLYRNTNGHRHNPTSKRTGRRNKK